MYPGAAAELRTDIKGRVKNRNRNNLFLKMFTEDTERSQQTSKARVHGLQQKLHRPWYKTTSLNYNRIGYG